MVDTSRVLRDLGPVCESELLLHDLFNPMHLRMTVRFDHQIDDDLIREAWEKTKRVYPILDAVLEFDEGDTAFFRDDRTRIEAQDQSNHMYFAAAKDGCNVPVKTKIPLVPNTEFTANRMIAVSYYGDSVSVGSYHILIDGRGFQMVLGTFVYTYLALYTGHEDERPIVELREGRSPEEYYVPADPQAFYAQEDFAPVPVYWLPLGCKGFWDDDMEYVEGVIWNGTIEVDAADFMRLCKSNKANPSSMIATLLGRAAYALNPEQQKDIVFGFTLSARDALGLKDSIANVVSDGVGYATRDEIEHKSLAEVSQRIRAELDQQRTRDYILTYRRVFETFKRLPSFEQRTITYIGSFSIGDNDAHIAQMSMGTNGCANLYLFQVRDRFVLSLYHGEATQRYLDEFVKIFDELGVKSRITQRSRLADLDASAPVV